MQQKGKTFIYGCQYTTLQVNPKGETKRSGTMTNKIIKFKKQQLENMLMMLKQSGAQEVGVNIEEE